MVVLVGSGRLFGVAREGTGERKVLYEQSVVKVPLTRDCESITLDITKYYLVSF